MTRLNRTIPVGMTRTVAWIVWFAVSSVFASAAALAAAPAAPAAESIALVEPRLAVSELGRYVYEIEGDWDFILEEDAEALGLATEPEVARGPWSAGETRRLAVPGCFTAQVDGLENFTGSGWYRVRISMAELPEDVVDWTLYFEGIAHQARIFVNGDLIRESSMAYLPTNSKIPRSKWRGADEVEVAVRCSNLIDPEGIPDSEWDGWWNHAGIYRRLFLIGHSAPIDYGSTAVRTYMKDRARGPESGWLVIAVPALFEEYNSAASIDGYTLEGTLTFPGANADGSDAVFTDRKVVDWATRGLQFEVPGSIDPWSPGRPNLGELLLTVADDEGEIEIGTRVKVGLRELWIEGSKVIFNGEQLRLFGFAYHELYPGRGYAVGVDQIRRDLEGMKELGANFVRSAHYPPHPIIPEICNELGLILWSEIPAWKTAARTLARQSVRYDRAPRYLRRMIATYLPHPSICFWSVGNEFDSTDPRVRDYVIEAADVVRGMDPTRIVTYASDRREEDISLDSVDVISINEYFGWYYGDQDDVGPTLDRMAAQHPGRPIFVSEFGAGAVAGQRERTPGARRDYSEPAQAAYLRRHIEQIFTVERSHYMLGGSVWLWADFADPHRTEKHHPKEWHGVNTKGVLTQDRRPKESYEMLREIIPNLGITQ